MIALVETIAGQLCIAQMDKGWWDTPIGKIKVGTTNAIPIRFICGRMSPLDHRATFSNEYQLKSRWIGVFWKQGIYANPKEPNHYYWNDVNTLFKLNWYEQPARQLRHIG